MVEFPEPHRHPSGLAPWNAPFGGHVPFDCPSDQGRTEGPAPHIPVMLLITSAAVRDAALLLFLFCFMGVLMDRLFSLHVSEIPTIKWEPFCPWLRCQGPSRQATLPVTCGTQSYSAAFCTSACFLQQEYRSRWPQNENVAWACSLHLSGMYDCFRIFFVYFLTISYLYAMYLDHIQARPPLLLPQAPGT